MPMRDGVVLRADVYRPDAGRPGARDPVCRTRTTAAPADAPRPPLDPERAMEAGFALVVQDMRGRYASEGEFDPFAPEARGRLRHGRMGGRPALVRRRGRDGGPLLLRRRPVAGGGRAAAAPEGDLPGRHGSDYYHGWVYQGGAFQLGFNLFWVNLMSEPQPRGVAARTIQPRTCRSRSRR